MPLPREVFRARIWAAMWEFLDRLAARIDRRYEHLGIPKRPNDRDTRRQHTKSKKTWRSKS